MSGAKVSIYDLYDPLHDVPFYVGQTERPIIDRLNKHAFNKGFVNPLKALWIWELFALRGVKAEIRLLDVVSPDEADRAEVLWMIRHLSDDYPLVNRYYKDSEFFGVSFLKAKQMAGENLLAWARKVGDMQTAKEILRVVNENNLETAAFSFDIPFPPAINRREWLGAS